MILVLIYICVFIPPALQEPESGARFQAVFVAVFMLLFFLIIFIGSYIYKIILSALGIEVLSSGGEIIKTDFGHENENPVVRLIVNIAGDSFFNLIFVISLIFLAVFSASVANNAASAI